MFFSLLVALRLIWGFSLLTSGSGHGEDRLFFALDGMAGISPSCLLFLRRFGFSVSWTSVKGNQDNDNQTPYSHNKTAQMCLDSETTEQNCIGFRCEFKRESRSSNIHCSLRRWFTSEESCWLFNSLLGFFVSFLHSSLFFARLFQSGGLQMCASDEQVDEVFITK